MLLILPSYKWLPGNGNTPSLGYLITGIYNVHVYTMYMYIHVQKEWQLNSSSSCAKKTHHDSSNTLATATHVDVYTVHCKLQEFLNDVISKVNLFYTKVILQMLNLMFVIRGCHTT